jgi:cytochrome c5
LGDKKAWGERTAKGLDRVLDIAKKGKGAMPPKGGFAGSDADFKAVVEYMVNASK